ncbi:MAG: ATP-binding protein [Pseudomonadota bacterium]
MTQWLSDLLAASAQFMPHGHCYLWMPALLWLHVGSDLLIGTAYVGIAALLWLLVQRLRLPFSPVFVAFGLFIALCGGTHFMQAWTVWNPDYWADGLLKGATAAASVATAVGLLFVKPQVEEVVHAARLSEERRIRLESTHAELELLYRKVKELDELKSQFFANVSHELRTPLALILGPAQQLLNDENLTPQQRRQIRSMHDNAGALLKQVNDLLDLSKLEAGRMSLDYAELALAPWCRRIAAQFEGVAEQRGIELAVEAAPGEVAEVDADKLERVLVNLLSNAFKFTPPGGRIRVSLQAPDDTLVLRVADSGPGVPPPLREAIFERFRQADGGASRTHGGTGLGLAIVKEFAELHGGEVSVGDGAEGGALFTVRLPRRAPAGAQVRSMPPTPGAGARVALEASLRELRAAHAETGPQAASCPAGAPRVLLVEDHAEMRRFVVELLAGDYAVSTAVDGEEGLARAEALRPDLIVTDVMMPRVSGDQLVAALRRKRELDTTPILLLTAKADDQLRVHLLEQGAQDYLTKPFLPGELRARVRNLVAAKRAGDTLRGELASLSTDLEQLAHDIAVKNRHLQTALQAAELAREQAEQAHQVKSQFLGMLSHEMRTPLSTVHMTLYLLSRDRTLQMPGPMKAKLERLTVAARQLHALIEGLLAYTRVESGRIIPQQEPVDALELARETVEEYRLELPPGPVTLALAPDAAAPPAMKSDRRLLKLVLSNLVGNAIKFTDEGRITVGLQSRPGLCVIEVHDTGIGIPPEDLDRVFLPFEQLEPVRRKSLPGVGLGLALVRHIVQALGGSLEVVSQPGEGSTFRVLLPLEPASPYPATLFPA